MYLYPQPQKASRAKTKRSSSIETVPISKDALSAIVNELTKQNVFGVPQAPRFVVLPISALAMKQVFAF
jgi:hypothetical protein